MTEGDTINVDFGAGVAVPLKLLARVQVWGVPYWSCLMGETPVLLSEERLEVARIYCSDEFEPIEKRRRLG